MSERCDPMKLLEGTTAGPWSFSPSERNIEAQVWDSEGQALLFFHEPRHVGSVATANARLIAAAPTLASDLAAAKKRERALVAALKVIANFPLPEQDNFHGTNMRAVAARTLDTHAPNWRTTP